MQFPIKLFICSSKNSKRLIKWAQLVARWYHWTGRVEYEFLASKTELAINENNIKLQHPSPRTTNNISLFFSTSDKEIYSNNYVSFVIEKRLNYDDKHFITDLFKMKFQSFQESIDSYFYVEILSNTTFIHLLAPLVHQMWSLQLWDFWIKVSFE